MINDNTILSSFNDRPTLLEWLKKVEEALKTDTATGVSVENPSVNSYIFKITFADGNTIASDTIKFPDSVNGVSISNNHLIITTQGGIREDLGVINPYADTIVLNSESNTTEIKNNAKIDGNLKVNSSISSGYNTESSIIVNEAPVEGVTLSLVDGVNFVKEKDDLYEVHVYVQMTKTTGSYSFIDGLTISSSFVPSHHHVYLVPYGTSNGVVTGYMTASINENGIIRLADWNGIGNGTRYIYLDFLYYKH